MVTSHDRRQQHPGAATDEEQQGSRSTCCCAAVAAELLWHMNSYIAGLAVLPHRSGWLVWHSFNQTTH